MHQNRNFLQGQKLYEVRVVFQQIPSVIEAPERNSVLVWPFWFWFGIFVLCQENQFGLEMGRDAASRAQAVHFFQQAARVRFTLYLRNELVLCLLYTYCKASRLGSSKNGVGRGAEVEY